MNTSVILTPEILITEILTPEILTPEIPAPEISIFAGCERIEFDVNGKLFWFDTPEPPTFDDILDGQAAMQALQTKYALEKKTLSESAAFKGLLSVAIKAWNYQDALGNDVPISFEAIGTLPAWYFAPLLDWVGDSDFLEAFQALASTKKKKGTSPSSRSVSRLPRKAS